MSGHIYVIDNGNAVKIGVSIAPEQRIRHLENQGGFTCVNKFISAPHDDYYSVESKAHEDLIDCRSVGEWFNVDFDTAVSVVEVAFNYIHKGTIKKYEKPVKKPTTPEESLALEFLSFQIASLNALKTHPQAVIEMATTRFKGRVDDESLGSLIATAEEFIKKEKTPEVIEGACVIESGECDCDVCEVHNNVYDAVVDMPPMTRDAYIALAIKGTGYSFDVAETEVDVLEDLGCISFTTAAKIDFK